jgi:hypothetical protein
MVGSQTKSKLAKLTQLVMLSKFNNSWTPFKIMILYHRPRKEVNIVFLSFLVDSVHGEILARYLLILLLSFLQSHLSLSCLAPRRPKLDSYYLGFLVLLLNFYNRSILTAKKLLLVDVSYPFALLLVRYSFVTYNLNLNIYGKAPLLHLSEKF